MALEGKKLALFRILEILKEETDINHTLTHNEIVEKLAKKYDIELERKSVAANISALRECGYDIVTNSGVEKGGRNGGSYLREREFEDTEIKLLIDAVIYSQYISEKHSSDLIKKLMNLSNKYFKIHNKNFLTLKNKYKTDNAEVFLNMELIDEAIDKHRKITYEYIKLNDKKETIIDSTHTISPYGYVLHNQRYYLLGFSDKWKGLIFHRLQWMRNIQILDDKEYVEIKEVKEFKNGIDYENLITARPYMYTDPLEYITMKVNVKRINDIFDWFGKDITVKKDNDETLLVIVKASPMAMKYWAMQYIDSVEIITPKKLRDNIKETLKNGIKKYK